MRTTTTHAQPHPDTPSITKHHPTSQRKYTEAQPYFQMALSSAAAGFGPRDGHVASAANNLAELYRILGQYGDAVPLYEQVCDVNVCVCVCINTMHGYIVHYTLYIVSYLYTATCVLMTRIHVPCTTSTSMYNNVQQCTTMYNKKHMYNNKHLYNKTM